MIVNVIDFPYSFGLQWFDAGPEKRPLAAIKKSHPEFRENPSVVMDSLVGFGEADEEHAYSAAVALALPDEGGNPPTCVVLQKLDDSDDKVWLCVIVKGVLIDRLDVVDRFEILLNKLADSASNIVALSDGHDIPVYISPNLEHPTGIEGNFVFDAQPLDALLGDHDDGSLNDKHAEEVTLRLMKAKSKFGVYVALLLLLGVGVYITLVVIEEDPVPVVTEVFKQTSQAEYREIALRQEKEWIKRLISSPDSLLIIRESVSHYLGLPAVFSGWRPVKVAFISPHSFEFQDKEGISVNTTLLIPPDAKNDSSFIFFIEYQFERGTAGTVESFINVVKDKFKAISHEPAEDWNNVLLQAVKKWDLSSVEDSRTVASVFGGGSRRNAFRSQLQRLGMSSSYTDVPVEALRRPLKADGFGKSDQSLAWQSGLSRRGFSITGLDFSKLSELAGYLETEDSIFIEVVQFTRASGKGERSRWELKGYFYELSV